MKELEESYTFVAKSELTKIRNRPHTVLESMIINVGESILKDDSLKDKYVIEGHIDMDKMIYYS